MADDESATGSDRPDDDAMPPATGNGEAAETDETLDGTVSEAEAKAEAEAARLGDFA